MKISPFTPLCFEPYISDSLPSRYIQAWAPTDRIMVQVLADAEEGAPVGVLHNEVTEVDLGPIDWQSWEMNTGKVLYWTVLSGLTAGYYSLTIDEEVSDVFRVTDDEQLLARTALIQYRFKDNRQRDDVVSVIDGVPYFFDFRVPGGFKDSGLQFGVENEQFSTQHADLVELYARDYITKTFTLGGPEGVPVWYGALLNRLLTCSYVYFDGVRYSRNESETPSISTLVDGMDSFVFAQALRQMNDSLETVESAGNVISMRRVASDNEQARIVNDSNILIIEETQV